MHQIQINIRRCSGLSRNQAKKIEVDATKNEFYVFYRLLLPYVDIRPKHDEQKTGCKYNNIYAKHANDLQPGFLQNE